MAFGISPETLALSPAQILSDEINRKQLALAEKRLALEERSLTLRSIPSGGGGGGTRRVYNQPGRISDPVAAVRASFGESWITKEKRELAEKTRLAEETQAKRREAFQQRQAQGKLAEQYGAAGFVPKAPKGWEKPEKPETSWGKSGITTSARSKILGALKGGKYKSEFGMTLPLTNQKQAIDFVQRYGHLNYKEDPGIMEIIGSLPTGREKKKKRGFFFKKEQPAPTGKWWLD